MNSLLLSMIEFFSSFTHAQPAIVCFTIIGGLFFFAALGGLCENRANVPYKLLMSFLALSVFIISTSFLLLKGTTLPENTCFTNIYRNPYPTNKNDGEKYKLELSKINDAIVLGNKLNISNMNDLLYRKNRYEELLKNWETNIKEDQNYPKKVEFFVVKINEDRMTTISENKRLYVDHVVSIDESYEFKRSNCSQKISQVATEMKQSNKISFNQ